MLTAEELLAGNELTFEIQIPAQLLHASNGQTSHGQTTHEQERANSVRLRPLTIRDLQLVARAAKESDTLVATLMVQRALVEPELSVAQVATMTAGLAQFLLHHVNRISGITSGAEQLTSVAEAPLAKAAFVLAKEFGWTPQEVNNLTLGQVLLHLQMLNEQPKA